MEPTCMSLISQRGVPQIGVGPSGTTRDEDTNLDMVEESLMQLTILIPYTRDEDILIHMHLYIGGVEVTLHDCSTR